MTAASPIAELHPAYFALVMATGIVSLACHLLGWPLLADGLFVLNLAFYPTLLVLTAIRNSQIYLVPHTVREFPAHAYALLQDPQQQVGETTDWTWVMGASITSGQLEIVAAGQSPERLALTPYRVNQVAGTTLGYQIQQFVPDSQHPNAAPDLVGFPIHIDQPGSGFQIRMVSPQGEVLTGSSRLVRTPSATPLSLLLLVSAIPLAVGTLVIVRRRRQLRLPRNLAGAHE